MKMRNIQLWIAASLVFALLSLSSCGSKTSEGNAESTAPSGTQQSTNSQSGLKTFTKEEMKKYDGKNGNPAYIAIDGKVYDVTNAPRWREGMHEGVEAGNDLTSQMKNAPHGLSKLEEVKVVGTLK